MNDLRKIRYADELHGRRGARPLGLVGEFGVYSCSILVDLARMLGRRKRGRDRVRSEYDRGEWAQQSEARDWDRSETLEAYVDKIWAAGNLTCMIDGRLWRMPVADYYRLRRVWLGVVLRRFAEDVAELVEVGSGSGDTLFALHLEGGWRSLRGLELSPTGRRVAHQVAERFGLQGRISFAEIDLLEASSSGFRGLEGSIVFTHCCLEQLPDDTELVMRNLCRAGVKRVIHVEPSYELLKAASLRDLAQMSYLWRQDFQRAILSTARRLEAEGLIRIVAAERLYCSSNWRNAPTAVVWEPA